MYRSCQGNGNTCFGKSSDTARWHAAPGRGREITRVRLVFGRPHLKTNKRQLVMNAIARVPASLRQSCNTAVQSVFLEATTTKATMCFSTHYKRMSECQLRSQMEASNKYKHAWGCRQDQGFGSLNQTIPGRRGGEGCFSGQRCWLPCLGSHMVVVGNTLP